MSPTSPKPPQLILPQVWAFAPNRDTLGGTAYYLQHPAGGVLIDCPAWNPVNEAFLREAGVQYCVFTHRGGIASAAQWRSSLNCTFEIQEQEAYLLPGLQPHTFGETFTLGDTLEAIWTPGHSPGSTCWLWKREESILFTGRHLLPDATGTPTPLYTRKTFHWPRQVRSVDKLRQRFSTENLSYICPGANLGLLRGHKVIDRAAERLQSLDIAALYRCDRELS